MYFRHVNLQGTIEKLTKDVMIEQSTDKNVQSTQEPHDYGKGVIFYLRDNIIIGIVLWNIFNRMSIARQVSN